MIVKIELKDQLIERVSEYAQNTIEAHEDGNLFGSKIGKNSILHLPIFDLDFPAYLIQSRTPGHFHLIIDKPVSTEQYETLCNAFFDAGLIQKAWRDNLFKHGQQFLRVPHFFTRLVHRYKAKRGNVDVE